MSNRGRPRTPDILTPREYEVLALLRKGLSNREVAERLGISLAGAKFHVSEIISKLGVESREETAAWRGQPGKRWGFAPSFANMRFGSISWPPVTLRVVLTAAAGFSSIGLIGALVLAPGSGSEHKGAGLAELAPTPTPAVLPCAQVEVICQVRNDLRTEVASLEEAEALATFPPRLPASIPNGFKEVSMVHVRPEFFTVHYPDGRQERNDAPFRADPYHDSLGTMYYHANGSFLSVDQGYSIIPYAWYEMAPEGMKGTLTVNHTEVWWVQGSPKPTEEADLLNPREGATENRVDGGFTLYWTLSSVELDAWEKSPDGKVSRSSRPFEYMISSDSLSLEELLEIAASVPQ